MYGAFLIGIHSLVQHLEITRALRSAASQNLSGARLRPDRASPRKIEEGASLADLVPGTHDDPSQADDYISMFSGV